MHDEKDLWVKFLSKERICDAKKSSPGRRTEFEIDYDAILWSDPFRRLVDKTQVFPLPEDDHVHSRLTHSLEVASVGRTIGNDIGRQLASEVEGNIIPELWAADIGQIVSSACLAHDIGNPPFGHSGEDSIREWVGSNRQKLSDAGLAADEINELSSFEGNALGFRILVRHQQPQEGGLRLTSATLAAGAKYPCPHSGGWQKAITHRKKYGYFKGDAAIFAQVAESTGLKRDGEGWKRHPLAWLVEAADDIVNAIVDLEDGFRMHVIPYDDAERLLRAIAARSGNLEEREQRYRNAGPRNHLAALRSRALGILVGDVCKSFMAKRNDILDGSHNKPLLEMSDSIGDLQEIKKSVEKRCFMHPDVLSVEIAGHTVVGAILDALMEAAIFQPEAKLSKKLVANMDLIVSNNPRANPYLATLEVLEFLAGMTDRFAVTSYRRLRGIELPGRAG